MRIEEIFYKIGYRVLSNGNAVNKKGDKVGSYNRDYAHLTARNNGVWIRCKIHRLQSFQKYGKKMYEEGIMVRHLNGEKHDNSWENIAIGTLSQNMMDIPEDIRLAKALYATSFVRKYDKKDVKLFYEKCKSYKKTMKEFNISSKGTLHYILNK